MDYESYRFNGCGHMSFLWARDIHEIYEKVMGEIRPTGVKLENLEIEKLGNAKRDLGIDEVTDAIENLEILQMQKE